MGHTDSPAVRISLGPLPAVAGQPYTIGLLITDRNHNLAHGSFDWGDGTIVVWTRPAAAPTSLTHTYAHGGSYTLRATEEDTTFMRGSATASLTVMPPTPLPIPGPIPPAPLYPLTVVSGSGSGSYLAGTVVPIVASAAPAGQAFTTWIGAGVVAAIPAAPSTAVIMPASPASITATYAASGVATLPLLQSASLVYQGAFRVPQGVGFAYGGGQLAFNPAGVGSLYLGGYPNLLGEISIPAPVLSATVTDLATALLLQAASDPTEGKRAAQIASGTDSLLGGLLVYGGKLVGTAYIYYDASHAQTLSHYTRPLSLSALGAVGGFYDFGYGGKTGYVSGPLCTIPAVWQSLLGGPVLTQNFDIPIISRTSYGPAAFAFDPANLGVVSPVPSVGLMYFPNDGDFAGLTYAATSHVWNTAQSQGGCVFPEGARSVLYFSVHGDGGYCYGNGVDARPPYCDDTYATGSTASTDATGYLVTIPGLDTGGQGVGGNVWLHAQTTPQTYTAPGVATIVSFQNPGTLASSIRVDKPFPPNLTNQTYSVGELNCLDPESPYKGTHAYPYVYKVLAFNANDLAEVKAGTRSPQALFPYATWELTLPTPAVRHAYSTGSVAYDPATQRIFLAQGQADGAGEPLIHVFHVVP